MNNKNDSFIVLWEKIPDFPEIWSDVFRTFGFNLSVKKDSLC